MSVRWRRATSRSIRVVSFGGLSPNDLLDLAGFSPIVAPTRWRPATDVCETTEAVTLTVELAGVREEDLDIELYPDAVVVEGYRTPESCGGDAVYHSLLIRNGPFRIEVPLPGSVDLDHPGASLERGMLRITLPKGGADANDADTTAEGEANGRDPLIGGAGPPARSP